jgi:hypothetical protein
MDNKVIVAGVLGAIVIGAIIYYASSAFFHGGTPQPTPTPVATPTTTPTPPAETPTPTTTPGETPTPTPSDVNLEWVPPNMQEYETFYELSSKPQQIKEWNEYMLKTERVSKVGSSAQDAEFFSRENMIIAKKGNNLMFVNEKDAPEAIFPYTYMAVYLWNGNAINCVKESATGDLNCETRKATEEDVNFVKVMGEEMFKNVNELMWERLAPGLESLGVSEKDIKFYDLFDLKQGEERTIQGRTCIEFFLSMNWKRFYNKLKALTTQVLEEFSKQEWPDITIETCIDKDVGLPLKTTTTASFVDYKNRPRYIFTEEVTTIQSTVSDADIMPPQQ